MGATKKPGRPDGSAWAEPTTEALFRFAFTVGDEEWAEAPTEADEADEAVRRRRGKGEGRPLDRPPFIH